MAQRDAEPGVREAALWAYAFSGGEAAEELVAERAKEDPTPRVKEFAAEMARAGTWWEV